MEAIGYESVTIIREFPSKGTGDLQEMYTDFDKWVVTFSKIMKRSSNADKKGELIEHIQTLKPNDDLKNFLSDFLTYHLQSLALNGERKKSILKTLADNFSIDVLETYAIFYDYALLRLCDNSFRFFEYKSKL